MLGFLIDANNQTVSGQKRSLDDTTIFTIDDIMTVCLVMDNMVGMFKKDLKSTTFVLVGQTK